MDADGTERTETVTARIRPRDLARLDHMAVRRGVERSDLIVQAIDALLAQEAWSGGFIAPPAPMEIPPSRSRRFRRHR